MTATGQGDTSKLATLAGEVEESESPTSKATESPFRRPLYRPAGFRPPQGGEKNFVARLREGVEIRVDADQARELFSKKVEVFPSTTSPAVASSRRSKLVEHEAGTFARLAKAVVESDVWDQEPVEIAGEVGNFAKTVSSRAAVVTEKLLNTVAKSDYGTWWSGKQLQRASKGSRGPSDENSAAAGAVARAEELDSRQRVRGSVEIGGSSSSTAPPALLGGSRRHLPGFSGVLLPSDKSSALSAILPASCLLPEAESKISSCDEENGCAPTSSEPVDFEKRMREYEKRLDALVGKLGARLGPLKYDLPSLSKAAQKEVEDPAPPESPPEERSTAPAAPPDQTVIPADTESVSGSPGTQKKKKRVVAKRKVNRKSKPDATEETTTAEVEAATEDTTSGAANKVLSIDEEPTAELPTVDEINAVAEEKELLQLPYGPPAVLEAAAAAGGEPSIVQSRTDSLGDRVGSLYNVARADVAEAATENVLTSGLSDFKRSELLRDLHKRENSIAQRMVALRDEWTRSEKELSHLLETSSSPSRRRIPDPSLVRRRGETALRFRARQQRAATEAGTSSDLMSPSRINLTGDPLSCDMAAFLPRSPDPKVGFSRARQCVEDAYNCLQSVLSPSGRSREPSAALIPPSVLNRRSQLQQVKTDEGGAASSSRKAFIPEWSTSDRLLPSEQQDPTAADVVDPAFLQEKDALLNKLNALEERLRRNMMTMTLAKNTAAAAPNYAATGAAPGSSKGTDHTQGGAGSKTADPEYVQRMPAASGSEDEAPLQQGVDQGLQGIATAVYRLLELVGPFALLYCGERRTPTPTTPSSVKFPFVFQISTNETNFQKTATVR
ncbi:unnamed protein product [Amoebophrya sp. A120]|nr:unnamed protein product [Amoebophrya sp. A120]|eukprot:GSA120T00002483001.1